MVGTLIDGRADNDACAGHRDRQRDHGRPPAPWQPAQPARLLAAPVTVTVTRSGRGDVRLGKVRGPDRHWIVVSHELVTRASPCATRTAKSAATGSAASRRPPAPPDPVQLTRQVTVTDAW